MSLSECFSKLSWVFEVELLVFLFFFFYWDGCLINLFRGCFILFTLLSFRTLCFLCSSKQILLTFLGSCSNLCFSISNSTFEWLDFTVCWFVQICQSFSNLRIAFRSNCLIPSFINPLGLLSWGSVASFYYNILSENSSCQIYKLVLWFLLSFCSFFRPGIFTSIFPWFLPALW